MANLLQRKNISVSGVGFTLPSAMSRRRFRMRCLCGYSCERGCGSSDSLWSGGGMPMMELSHMTGCHGRRTGFSAGNKGCGGFSGSLFTSTYSSSSYSIAFMVYYRVEQHKLNSNWHAMYKCGHYTKQTRSNCYFIIGFRSYTDIFK